MPDDPDHRSTATDPDTAADPGAGADGSPLDNAPPVEDALDAAEATLADLSQQLSDDSGNAGLDGGTGGSGGNDTLDLLADVELDVSIELGRTEMLVEDVLRLGQGSVVELDKLAGDPVDVYVNGRMIARGEVLVLNDNFCIRINEIVADLNEQADQAIQQAAN